MRSTKYYIFNSIFMICIYIALCASCGFFLDFLLNLMKYHLEVPSTFHLMITGKLPLVFTFILFFLNLCLILITFINHAKIMLQDMKSHVLTGQETNNDLHFHIQRKVDSICQQINLKNVPTIHLADVAFPNAFVFGFGYKYQNLVITKSLITILEDQELRAVLTHQLLSIKHRISTLATTIALIGNIFIIQFDLFFYHWIYSFTNNTANTNRLKKFLRSVRFFIPIGTLYYRYFLDKDTIKILDNLTINKLSQLTLISALSKIERYHKDYQEFITNCYTGIRNNELRRESFIFESS